MALTSLVYLRADSIEDLADAEHGALVFVPDEESFCGYAWDSVARGWRRIAGQVSGIDPATEIDVNTGVLVPSASRVGRTSREQFLFDEITTIDATITPVYTSDVIPGDSVIHVESLILCKDAQKAGMAALSVQSVFERHSSGMLTSPQADRLVTTGSMGLAICTVLSSVDQVSAKFSINVKGKSATVLKWYSSIQIRRNIHAGAGGIGKRPKLENIIRFLTRD